MVPLAPSSSSVKSTPTTSSSRTARHSSKSLIQDIELVEAQGGGGGGESSSDYRQVLEDYEIALRGNGHDQELSKSQLHLMQQLYDSIASYRDALPTPEEIHACADYESCRRYLVARQWNVHKAYDQMVSTLQWRIQNHPSRRSFWESSKCLKNPLAMNMRMVGWDIAGRPIVYTCFRHAHDRWEIEPVMEHVLLLLEATTRFVRQRRRRRQLPQNQTADSRLCIWVVDFDGFGLRDQNPRTAVHTARLLQHYPELLHRIVLMDAPRVFSGMWKLIAPLLDDRVRSKILFVQGNDTARLLQEQLGQEAADWLARECQDNHDNIPELKKGNPKKYWIAPADKSHHDPRGMASYVQSDYYIKTPGDAYEERRMGLKTQGDEDRGEGGNGNNAHTVPIQPRAVQSLYKGSF